MGIMMRVIVVVVMCLTFTNYIYGMEWGYKNIKVYTLPGLGGHKPEEQEAQRKYAQMLFNNDDANFTIKPINTPEEHADLGQKDTMNYISNAIAADQANDTKEKKKYDGTVILASSQAAAAVMKLISQKKLEVPNLKGIFFEGLFMSGNDAFYHSIHGERPEDYKPLQGLPYVRWWAPYLAQFLKLRNYAPQGDQPIHFLADVPNVPIAIIHGEEDQRVDFNDAMVFYSQLRKRGNNNLYLFSKEAGPNTIACKKDHINVLDEQDLPAVHAILRKLKILPSAGSNAQDDEKLLSALQPNLCQEDIEHYTNLYNQIHERHAMHVEVAQRVNMARDVAKIAAGAAAVYVAVKILTRNRPNIAEVAATLSMLNPELLMVIMEMAELM